MTLREYVFASRLALLLVLALAFTPAAASRPADLGCEEIRGLNRHAIAQAREGQAIHQSWIDFIRAGYATTEEIKYNGDIAWQQRWVENYDAIITALTLARYSCEASA